MAEDKCLALISETNKPFNVQAWAKPGMNCPFPFANAVFFARQGPGACSCALATPARAATP